MATLTKSADPSSSLSSPYPDLFAKRHIGPSQQEIRAMLEALDFPSLDAFIDAAIPPQIRSSKPLALGRDLSEQEALAELKDIASKNRILRSFIGCGYSDCIVPPVILRNVLENPGWYTQYTPYQSEIAQGRLEALLNFQTMIVDLTGLDVANASLLDEATAAAEAMTLCHELRKDPVADVFYVSQGCHPQTRAVVETRARPLGIQIVIGEHNSFAFDGRAFGALVQYPASDGALYDYRELCGKAHSHGALVVVAADLLGLTLLKPPGEFGADVAIGSAQRFGVPLGYGGPHAAYFATRQAYLRHMPGRIVGISKDASGAPALRLAIQTREQHIRREKATSNICTAQVLLAILASMYAVYHGPEGLKTVALRIHRLSCLLALGLKRLGFRLGEAPFFDTLRVFVGSERLAGILAKARGRLNVRVFQDSSVGIALDEKTSIQEIRELLTVFAGGRLDFSLEEEDATERTLPDIFQRSSPYLAHAVFNSYHSETKMLRYLHRLQSKDLSLTTSMIPLGSCTMKLNASAEMLPVSWPEFSGLHPFAPLEQAEGYQILFKQLESMLGEITGFARVSLQPNAGSQGEYAGLLIIRKYHESRGQGQRDICLIPQSAHGTNPASAALAGLKTVAVLCDEEGNIDLADLKAKAQEHGKNLAAIMVTYPSTHGVFEEGIQELCRIIHSFGGQVYMDGANLNAQVGLCRPAELGADVCHLNLHKTFCIPHGGGGPGMGPIGVSEHLAPFLPTHPLVKTGGSQGIGPVSAAPWGSASILPISWMYIKMMGSQGLTRATEVAILNANYIARKLSEHYPVLYKGRQGLVAHECILDIRPLKNSCGITVEDVAKRLMDYGFHAPTISWPVAGTMMIEPTESESKEELDRFCEAMILIREEIRQIENKKIDPNDNPLKNAPHTALAIASDSWTHPYSREKAAFPASWTKEHKYWPPVGRIDNPYGDRNFLCSCTS